MSERSQLINRVKGNAGLRFAVLFGSFFILLILSSLISAGINGIEGISQRDASLASSVVQCVLAFCLPAFLTAKFASIDPYLWLRIKKLPSLLSIAGVIIVYILFTPAMNQIVEWNENIHFGESLSSLENTLRNWEEASQKISNIILMAYSPGAVISGVLIIGLLTGFSEELFFRGALQRIFSDSAVGKTAAIFSAAFIFSFFHFQFFGFFPRWIMGIFFGYLLVWTQNLWVPIFAHFLNNSIVVITYAIIRDEHTIENIQTFGVNENGAGLMFILSIAATFIFIFIFGKIFFRRQN